MIRSLLSAVNSVKLTVGLAPAPLRERFATSWAAVLEHHKRMCAQCAVEPVYVERSSEIANHMLELPLLLRKERKAAGVSTPVAWQGAAAADATAADAEGCESCFSLLTELRVVETLAGFALAQEVPGLARCALRTLANIVKVLGASVLMLAQVHRSIAALLLNFRHDLRHRRGSNASVTPSCCRDLSPKARTGLSAALVALVSQVWRCVRTQPALAEAFILRRCAAGSPTDGAGHETALAAASPMCFAPLEALIPVVTHAHLTTGVRARRLVLAMAHSSTPCVRTFLLDKSQPSGPSSGSSTTSISVSEAISVGLASAFRTACTSASSDPRPADARSDPSGTQSCMGLIPLVEFASSLAACDALTPVSWLPHLFATGKWPPAAPPSVGGSLLSHCGRRPGFFAALRSGLLDDSEVSAARATEAVCAVLQALAARPTVVPSPLHVAVLVCLLGPLTVNAPTPGAAGGTTLVTTAHPSTVTQGRAALPGTSSVAAASEATLLERVVARVGSEMHTPLVKHTLHLLAALLSLPVPPVEAALAAPIELHTVVRSPVFDSSSCEAKIAPLGPPDDVRCHVCGLSAVDRITKERGSFPTADELLEACPGVLFASSASSGGREALAAYVVDAHQRMRAASSLRVRWTAWLGGQARPKRVGSSVSKELRQRLVEAAVIKLMQCTNQPYQVTLAATGVLTALARTGDSILFRTLFLGPLTPMAASAGSDKLAVGRCMCVRGERKALPVLLGSLWARVAARLEKLRLHVEEAGAVDWMLGEARAVLGVGGRSSFAVPVDVREWTDIDMPSAVGAGARDTSGATPSRSRETRRLFDANKTLLMAAVMLEEFAKELACTAYVVQAEGLPRSL